MRRLAVVALLAFSAGCGPAETGGGGDTTPVGFSSGIAYAKGGDIWVADASDYENKAQRLTTDQGNDQPALSRDGKVVAYVHTDATSGATTVYTVPSGGGTPAVLVPSSQRTYSGLCWAPGAK